MTQLKQVHPGAVESIYELVHKLVLGKYEEINLGNVSGRLTSSELRDTIIEYDERITDIPIEVLAATEVIAVKTFVNTWAIDLDLWTNKGLSDLTLSLTISISDEILNLYIDDLHVL